MPRENARHLIVAAIREIRPPRAPLGTMPDAVEAVQAREELEVLPRGQLGIEMEFVREHADPAANVRAGRRAPCAPP